MNRKQKLVLLLGVVVFIFAGLYPQWIMAGGGMIVRRGQRAWLLDPKPTLEKIPEWRADMVRVDLRQLCVEWTLVCVVTVVAVLLLADKKPGASDNKASKREQSPGCEADMVVPEGEVGTVAQAATEHGCETADVTEWLPDAGGSAEGQIVAKETMPLPVRIARIIFLVTGAVILSVCLVYVVGMSAAPPDGRGASEYFLVVGVPWWIGSLMLFLAAYDLKRGNRVGATLLPALSIVGLLFNRDTTVAAIFAVLGAIVLVAVYNRRSAEWLRERRKEYRVRGGKT